MISMPFFRRLAAHAAILVAAGTLTACQVDVDQGGGYDPGPRMCTREYAPVCGTRRGEIQTFANACEARSSGYDIIGRGECRSRRPDTGWEDERERPRDRVNIGWQDRSRDRDEDRSARERDRRGEDREVGRSRDRERERVDNRRRDPDIRLGLDGGETRADRSGREERENPRCADKRLAKRDPACAVN